MLRLAIALTFFPLMSFAMSCLVPTNQQSLDGADAVVIASVQSIDRINDSQYASIAHMRLNSLIKPDAQNRLLENEPFRVLETQLGQEWGISLQKGRSYLLYLTESETDFESFGYRKGQAWVFDSVCGRSADLKNFGFN